MKFKYITRLSLACGVMITAVAFSGCSGSPKAVQANAAVVSSGVMSTEPNSEASDVSSSSTVTSSSLVSNSATQVSSDALTSGVTSQKSSSLTSLTSKPSTGGSTSKPVSVKPASPKPASKAPAPASKAPAPASKAPVSQSISAKYHGATYGCEDKSQYDTVLQKAAAVKGSSKYNRTYDAYKGDAEGFKAATGVDYSEEWLDIASIRGYFGQTGTGDPSYGNAYDYFTGANSMCADKSKALEAALHCAGYDARLALGTTNGSGHMWVQVKVGGSWYNLTKTISTSVNSGYTLSSTGYNL